MGERRKNKWTKEEQEALIAGIAKHGAGKWMEILDDPDFATQLVGRTNVNLKDKWRNLKRFTIQTIEPAPISTVVSSEPHPISTVINSEPHPISTVVNSEPYPISSSEDSSSPISSSDESRYEEIVLEAISTMDSEYGSDLSEILSYIQERYEVPQNFKKLLSDDLRILVSQGKLEKIVNSYKISSELKSKELEIAAEEAAMRLADSENKAFLAEEAVKEADQMLKLAEESRTMLLVCLDIHEQCKLGKKVYLKDLCFG